LWPVSRELWALSSEFNLFIHTVYPVLEQYLHKYQTNCITSVQFTDLHKYQTDCITSVQFTDLHKYQTNCITLVQFTDLHKYQTDCITSVQFTDLHKYQTDCITSVQFTGTYFMCYQKNKDFSLGVFYIFFLVFVFSATLDWEFD